MRRLDLVFAFVLTIAMTITGLGAYVYADTNVYTDTSVYTYYADSSLSATPEINRRDRIGRREAAITSALALSEASLFSAEMLEVPETLEASELQELPAELMEEEAREEAVEAVSLAMSYSLLSEAPQLLFEADTIAVMAYLASAPNTSFVITGAPIPTATIAHNVIRRGTITGATQN